MGLLVTGSYREQTGQGNVRLIRCKYLFVRTYTGLCNHNRIVFEETTFKTKYIKSKYVRLFIMMILNLHNIIQKCILTLYKNAC